ncbi:MAG: hypothetical protein ACOY93_19040 [Bacillota bacterium]
MSQFTQGPQEPILKPRDLGQLLDRAFKVFGRSWKPLVAVGVFAAIPSVLMGVTFASIFPSDPTAPMDSWLIRIIQDAEEGYYGGLYALFSIGGILTLASLLLVPLYMGALVDVSTRAVLQMERVPLSESLRVGGRYYGPVLVTYLLKAILYLIPVPLYIVTFTLEPLAAGLLMVLLVLLSIPYWLTVAVFTVFANHAIIVEERGGGMPALRRAYELGRSRFWPLLGIGIVFYLLVYVLQSIITTPFAFASGIAMVVTQAPWLMALTYLFQGIAQAVGFPFLMVGQTLVYFDTRIRREGYDLEVMAQQQGAQPQAPQPVIAPPPDPQP